MKTVLYLQMTAVLLTVALAGPAAAGKRVPFHGSIQGVEIADVQFPRLFVDGSGSGRATHLGRFTVTSEFEVDLLTVAASGSAHFIAANGDSIFTESTAVATEAPNNLNLVVETHTITGGTGRFVGATGSFIEERLVNTITGFTSGSFDGFISY